MLKGNNRERKKRERQRYKEKVTIPPKWKEKLMMIQNIIKACTIKYILFLVTTIKFMLLKMFASACNINPLLEISNLSLLNIKNARPEEN